MDNNLGHVDGNVKIACVSCNVARKTMEMKAFKRQKLVENIYDRLVFSIDDNQKEIYYKMKENIVGGPSIIFNRYAKRNETRTRGGKLVKKIIGYDANALCLWALGNLMPCGRLVLIDVYESNIDDIVADKQFGFHECDIEVPAELRDHFSEMTPIFKNVEIDPNDPAVIGKHMYEYNHSRGQNQAKKSRKLISSYFGRKILIYTPLHKLYLAHGLVVTMSYSFVKASAHRPFKAFMEKVSNARRDGDVDNSQAMIAEMMKLVGNSAFGRSGMDKTKHKQVIYETNRGTVLDMMEHFTFHNFDEFNGAYDVTKKKRQIAFTNPIHLSIAIYQLAKLRMLQFYYDFVDF